MTTPDTDTDTDRLASLSARIDTLSAALGVTVRAMSELEAAIGVLLSRPVVERGPLAER